MRILVISDTHGKNERVYDVYNKLASAGGPAARSGGLSGGFSSGLSDCLFGSRPAPQPGSHRTPPVDMIVHCGDYYADAQEIRARLGIPVLAVKGNCDGSGGTFALVTTSEAGLQAKIYYYEDFMLPAAGVGSTGGGADAPDNSAADNSAAGGTASAPETPASPAASPVAPAVRKPKQKPKVKGGHLRSLINYSDRF